MTSEIETPRGTERQQAPKSSPGPDWNMPLFLEALAYAMRRCMAEGAIDRYPNRLLVEADIMRATPVPDEVN